ncbi:MAG: hypothetical protein M1839_008148 [Geoglossum umbratile]|nr:MAG: hypothetical protein M1839_008148 [Geoglossum umbratile]
MPPLLSSSHGRSLPGNLPATPPPNTPSPSSDSGPGSAEMGPKLSFMGTILIPALISLALYLLTTYVLLPLFRRHRQRYAQYLPLPPSPSRLQSTLSFLIPSRGFFGRRSRSRHESHSPGGGDTADDDADSSVFDDEEGEDMVGFEIDERRREALERRRGSTGGGEVVRLSRDLEEGFRDDSSDEGEADPEVAVPGGWRIAR